MTWQEYTAVLVHPNIGLLPQVPVYGAAVLVGLILLAWIAPRRLACPAVIAAAASAAWLAFVAATATNVNHGGTPGLSRYATWFVPLAIPLFQECDRVLGRRVTWMTLPAVASAALGIWAFHPARPEAADRPTRLASFLWARHPSVDNPLPEIFAERLRGLDENWLPVATPGCEKVLLPGRGPRSGVWPIPCAPVAPPARCQQPGATCYANRTRTGTSSSSRACPRPRPSGWIASARGQRRPNRRRRHSGVAGVVEHARATSRRSGCRHPVVAPRRPVVVWQAENRFFAFAFDVQPGAELVALVTREMSGSFTVESGPIEGTRVRIRPGLARQAIRLPSPQPWVMLVAEAR